MSKIKATDKHEVIESLIAELKEASRVYYLTGSAPLMSDEDFDAKQEYLQLLADNPENEALFAPGTDGYALLNNDVLLGATLSNADAKITHETPMLSLDKAKDEKTLNNYLSRARKSGAKDFKLQAKLDGLAISIRYDNGEITVIATRGNGNTGENYSYLKNNAKLHIKGLPEKLSINKHVELRGEIFLTNEQFEKVNASRVKATGEAFDNARNAVAGLLRKAERGLDYDVEVTFSTYIILCENEIQNLDFLDGEGLVTVDDITKQESGDVKLTGFADDADVFKAINDFGVKRESFGIPTDGVVVKPVNEAEMYVKLGVTSHHPVSQIAWKYPSEKAESVIREIILTVGKSGKITPTAEIDPVRLNDTTVSRASLHNFNIIVTKDVRVGSLVIVEKANEIIPQIVTVLSNPEGSVPTAVPTECPVCGAGLVTDDEDKLKPKTLLCPNPDCSSRRLFALVTAVGKTYLDINGLSEATLTALFEAGTVTKITDIYALNVDDLSGVVMGKTVSGKDKLLGEKNATKIIDSIQRSLNVSLDKVLASLAIPNLGRTVAKDLVKRFGSLDAIRGLVVSDIEPIKGYGEKTASSIVEGLKRNSDVLDVIAGLEFKFNDSDIPVVPAVVNVDSPLAGLSFSISGNVPAPFANRNEWVDYLEANGAVFNSSPKKGTSFIVADPDGSSSKVKAAIKNGVEFISDDDFTSKFVI